MYIHLNAECQRIARKDKKAFLDDQCKKENNRMEMNRDFFTKTRGTKGIFHAKMDTIKDWNGMDLTETEDINKRCFLTSYFCIPVPYNEKDIFLRC